MIRKSWLLSFVDETDCSRDNRADPSTTWQNSLEETMKSFLGDYGDNVAVAGQSSALLKLEKRLKMKMKQYEAWKSSQV